MRWYFDKGQFKLELTPRNGADERFVLALVHLAAHGGTGVIKSPGMVPIHYDLSPSDLSEELEQVITQICECVRDE